MLLLSLVLALGASACDAGDEDGGETQAREAEGAAAPKRGGTFRVQWDAFQWTANFDPTGEYLGDAHGILANTLVRTLMGYRHVAGPRGNELVPDLAAAEPEVSEDGLTYTFKLREGVKFAPPVNRDVTSRDVAYAFERIGTRSLAAQYGFYFLVIEGMDEFTKAGGLSKKGNKISGIRTPDDSTIVFTLREPTGDFLYRLATVATGPIPHEVAKCFLKAGEYGRFLISSGPYMIDGSDELDLGSCKAMKPLSGFDPSQRLILVRNPNYDQATDEYRKNYIDRFEHTLNTNGRDVFDRVKAGRLELSYASELPQVVREYTTNDELTDRYKTFPGDWMWYITMNLTQPPFDDIHVRKAMNWVMDKEGLRRAWGGPVKGDVAHHIVPDTMFNNELEDYAPYKTEGDAGDVEKAKEEMAQSKYDTNGDGVCDAWECKNVLHVTRNTDVWANMTPVIEKSARKIGVELATRGFDDSYAVIQLVKRNVPISSAAGWGKDFADPSTFMILFDSRTIVADGNLNYSLVGLTPEQAEEVGAKGRVAGIPNVDADIDRCAELSGDDRLQCWVDLDKKIMEEIVPWVPYLDANADNVVSDAVTHYVFDQSFATPAYSRIAMDESKAR